MQKRMNVSDEPISDQTHSGSATSLPIFVIVAAHNEEKYIAGCLEALLNQDETAGPLRIVVAANACTDQTIPIVKRFQGKFAERAWPADLLEIADPGKLNAFNRAEEHISRISTAGARVYLDADVTCDPEIFGQLREALSTPKPVYATGKLQVSRAKSWVTRHYARIWVNLPFMRDGAVGAGLFAVNAAGRSRWAEFPDIISDDTFVRLNFSPAERKEVPARYHWPMVEGLYNLVRVRKRQDLGVQQVQNLYPALMENDQKSRMSIGGITKLALTEPLGFAVYGLVHILVRFQPSEMEWTRGR